MKRAKIIVCLVALFLFGGVCGAVLTARWARQSAQRVHWEHRWIHERMTEDATRLKLTPEQIEKARPLYDQMLADLRKIREDAGRSIIDAGVQHARNLAQVLTPEQQQEFQKLSEQRRALWLKKQNQ